MVQTGGPELSVVWEEVSWSGWRAYDDENAGALPPLDHDWRWLIYGLAVWWVGMTCYELISGKIISQRIFYTWTRDERPKTYWFGFCIDLGLTIFFCYLAYDLASSGH